MIRWRWYAPTGLTDASQSTQASPSARRQPTYHKEQSADKKPHDRKRTSTSQNAHSGNEIRCKIKNRKKCPAHRWSPKPTGVHYAIVIQSVKSVDPYRGVKGQPSSSTFGVTSPASCRSALRAASPGRIKILSGRPAKDGSHRRTRAK